MNGSINRFIAPRILAVAGASDNKKKFGYLAYRELKKRGYILYPLNSFRETVDGDKCYSCVTDLPVHVKNILIITPPDITEKIVYDIDSSAIDIVWMQNGAESIEALKICKEKEIEVIYNRCILMHAHPVRSYHLAHRIWWLATGELNKD